MERFIICLRDFKVPHGQPVRMVSEFELKAEEFIEEEKISITINQFVNDLRARKVTSIKKLKSRYDVYIGYWAKQGTMIFPQSFFVLISELNIPVTIDFND